MKRKTIADATSVLLVNNSPLTYVGGAVLAALALIAISIIAPRCAVAQTDEETDKKIIDCATEMTIGQFHQHNAAAQLTHAKSKEQVSVAIQAAHAATREVIDGIEDCHPDFLEKTDPYLHLTYKSFTCSNLTKFLTMSFDATRRSDLTLTYFAEKAYADALDDCDLINDQR